MSKTARDLTGIISIKALDKLRAAGFEIVPKEPTEAMYNAYWDRCGPNGSLRDDRAKHNDHPNGHIKRAFQAMIAAASSEP